VRAQGDVGKGRELLASAVSLYKEMGDSKMQEQCDVLYGQVAQVRPTMRQEKGCPSASGAGLGSSWFCPWGGSV
jgi:hypothetical protein